MGPGLGETSVSHTAMNLCRDRGSPGIATPKLFSDCAYSGEMANGRTDGF